MKGLLLKDWYRVRTNMKTMYDGCICAGDLGAQHIERLCVPGGYAAIFLGILPVNLLTYDQSVGWVEYGGRFR